MPVINIKINDKTHQVACPEGEEEHLKNLADYFSDKVSSLVSSYPNAADTTLYMMAALMICDELDENKKKLAKLEKNPELSHQANNEAVEDAVVKTIDMVTEHLEYIASKLDKC